MWEGTWQHRGLFDSVNIELHRTLNCIGIGGESWLILERLLNELGFSISVWMISGLVLWPSLGILQLRIEVMNGVASPWSW